MIWIGLILLALIWAALKMTDAAEKVDGADVVIKAMRSGGIVIWSDREGDER